MGGLEKAKNTLTYYKTEKIQRLVLYPFDHDQEHRLVKK